MADRNLEAGKHQGFGWFDPEGFGLMGSIQGGLNKDHLVGLGTGLMCLPHITITSNAYLRLWHRELLSKSQGSVQENVVGQLDMDIDSELE